VKKSTENWIKIARRDLKVAADNLNLKNFTTTVEKCHSSLDLFRKSELSLGQLAPNGAVATFFKRPVSSKLCFETGLLEKLLKAIITEQDHEPSKIHNLLKLTSEALITNLQDDMQETLAELNSLFMSSRYPDDIDELDKKLTNERVTKILNETKRIFKWLEKK